MPIFPTTILAQSSFSGTTTLAATPTFYAATVGSSYTATLAASAGIAEGTIIHISIVSHTAAQTLTIARDGSDVIRHCGATSLTTFILDKPGAELILRKRSTGWDVIYVKGRQTQQVILTTPGAGAAGYGTTDLFVRRLTVTHTNVGTAITPATTLADGSSLTFNEFGDYDFIMSDGTGSATFANMGASVNATLAERAAVVETIALAKRLMSIYENYTTQHSGQCHANVSDVFRSHMGFTKPTITSTDGFVSITKIGE